MGLKYFRVHSPLNPDFAVVRCKFCAPHHMCKSARGWAAEAAAHATNSSSAICVDAADGAKRLSNSRARATQLAGDSQTSQGLLTICEIFQKRQIKVWNVFDIEFKVFKSTSEVPLIMVSYNLGIYIEYFQVEFDGFWCYLLLPWYFHKLFWSFFVGEFFKYFFHSVFFRIVFDMGKWQIFQTTRNIWFWSTLLEFHHCT